MSRFVGSVLILLSLFTLTACSSLGSSDEVDYKNSEITPTLEVPPDLITPGDKKNLVLPGSKVGLKSNSGRYIDTGNLNVESSVLPQVSDIKLKGQGDLHWLSIPFGVEKAYPLIREFWLEQGFELQMDEPLIGLMQTRWMGSKAGSASFFARIIERMKAAESKHQYVTRLERGADEASTRVFITHRQQDLVIKQDSEEIIGVDRDGWQFRAADPVREYEMLSRLMVFLGLKDEAVKTQLARIGTFTARASLQNGEEDEVAHVAVTHGFEQTWNRLRHQLDRLGVAHVETDRESNSGTLEIDSAAFYAGLQLTGVTEREKLRLVVEGHGNSDHTRIELLDEKGTLDRSEEAVTILQSVVALLK